MVVNNPNMVAPKAQPASARPAVETGVSAPRVAAQPTQSVTPTREPAPVYHPTNFAAQTASASQEANATATPANPHVSSQQGSQNGVSNASQSEHVQVTPQGVSQQTTTTQNGQTTQSSSFTPAQEQGQGTSTQGSAQNTAPAANTNVGRTNSYVNTQLPQNAQNSEKNTTIQVDHSKLDNDIAQAKQDGVQVTHTADDQPIVVHNQNEAHDFEDQASQEYDNEDQAIIKADNIQKAYNTDKAAADTVNQQVADMGKDAASKGVIVDTSKTQTIDFSGHTPSLQDAQTMNGQIQSLGQAAINKIKAAEDQYQQEVDQAYKNMGDTISGDDNDTASLDGTVNAGINNTQGVPAQDKLQHVGGHVVYCTQPYGIGPGVSGTSKHVTLNSVSDRWPADQQRTIAGILYLGNGGPGDKGTYSEMDTHLALAYYVYNNNIDGLRDWQQQHEGVTDQIADQWLHYGKVQQLLNEAQNWDKDGSILYKVFAGHSDNYNDFSSKGLSPQELVAANFTNRPKPITVPVSLLNVKTPTVKADYHYMSAKLGDTDTQTQTGGSAMPNININVSANASAQAKANANVNVNAGANANGQGSANGNANANGSANGCGMSRGHGCGMCGAGGRGCGAGAATGAGLGAGSGYGSCGMVESVPACGGYGAVDTGAGYGAGEASPLVATGAVSGQGDVAMPVAAAGNGAGVGAGNGAGNGVAMPATGQKNGSVLADLAAVAAAVIGGSMLLKKRNA